MQKMLRRSSKKDESAEYAIKGPDASIDGDFEIAIRRYFKNFTLN